MSETQYDRDELPDDDGVLEPSDSLETDDLSRDPLDTGLAAPDRWSVAEQYGTTMSDSHTDASLERRLAAEEPDLDTGDQDDPDSAWPLDGSPGAPRSGRLVADEQDDDPRGGSAFLAHDVGIDGGAAGAEEAAVHLVPDDAPE
jgi:hypothetical protein